ncbi:MAG: ATP-binding protein [Mycobacteriales bacterium]
MSSPAGAVGEALEATGDAVVIVDGQQVIAWSPGAADLFGVSREQAIAPGAEPLGDSLATLLALPANGVAVRLPLPPHGVLEVRHREVGGHQMLMIRDVSVEVRRSEGLRRLSRLSRGLLVSEEPSVSAVLATVAHAAREMTGATRGIVLLLGEPAQVVHDGPAGPPLEEHVHLFDTPARTRRPVLLPDLPRDGSAAGIEGPYPGEGPLLVVPLVAGIDVLGTLAVSSPAGGRVFDSVDQELLIDLAAHASVAIRWAQGIEKEQARQAFRSEVVRTARHDIRTPLGAGKGYATLLLTRQDRMTPDQVTLALEGLKQALERIQTMTDRLLVDEQLELGESAPTWAQVPIAPLLEEVRPDAAVVTGRPDAVRVEIAADVDVATGDRGMIREIVDNLVGNALKHAPSDQPVVLGARREGETIRLEVRDAGPGIAPADQARLFERWTQLDKTGRTATSGFGLGLSIVKRLADAHGGHVGIDSDLGKGATFWVTLPIRPPG